MLSKHLRAIRSEIEGKSKRIFLPATLLCVTLIFAGASSQAAQSVTLAWNASSGPNLAGYRVHYGTSSGIYTQTLNVVASMTTATVANLTAGLTYYFVITAYNTAGVESTYSNKVSFTATATSGPTPTPTL